MEKLIQSSQDGSRYECDMKEPKRLPCGRGRHKFPGYGNTMHRRHMCISHNLPPFGWERCNSVTSSVAGDGRFVSLSTVSVALLLVHHVDERLAVDEPFQVLADGADHARVVLVRSSGDVRSDDRVLELPERMALGQRL